MEKIKVVHKKLGRVKINKLPVDGYTDPDLNVAFIDERLKGYDHLYTLIHEALHVLNPRLAEMKVRGYSKRIADMLWDENYRKVLL